MFFAIVASIIALLVLAIVIIVVIRVRKPKSGSHASKGYRNVQKIDSVGVASTLSKQSKSSPRIKANSSHEGGAPNTGGLKSRFAALGVFGIAVFGAIAAKVGSMQVLSGDEYEREADENRYITVSTPAPRGLIYDAGGISLVQNKSSLTVLADVDVAADRDVVQRLSVLLGIPHNIIRKRILDTSSGAQSLRVVASDVTLRNIAFISEHADAFPGVSTETRMVREYPYGALGAHVVGYTAPITEDELATPAQGLEYELGDSIGKEGAESSYESVLAGAHGKRVVVAGADGVVREVVSETDPEKGNDVYLTIKAPVQKVADKALAALVAPGGDVGTGKGTAASLVCMDVRDGSIIALSNYPTYTPESFIGGISTEAWSLLQAPEAHDPMLNRAIAGLYPAASTFKAFTGLAGLEYGFADKERTWACGGTWTGFGSEYPQSCWLLSGHGTLDFRAGVVVSCDVVFYEIAKSFYDARATIGQTAMQDFIKRFGFGSLTQIDLVGERTGRIPTPEWKAEYFKDVPEEAGWLPGDMSNMSIGQGNVLVTPIQMAVAYGGVATGKLIRPHVLKEVRNSEGGTVLTAKAEELSQPKVAEDHYAIMRDALHGVSDEDTLVSREFYKYGIDAGSKTGTAEVAGKGDFGWFACYAPFEDPQYVVACVVEEGGAGAQTACPVSVEVLNAALEYDAGTLDMSVEYIAGSSGKSVPFAETSSATGRRD